MPKNQPKNAFYYFMLDFKQQEKRKGNIINNMADVANAAGPLWKDAPPHVRAKFEAIARQEKEKKNVPTNKFTSTGRSLAEIAQAERDLCAAEEAERHDIKNLVKLKTFNNAIFSEDIYLMDVNYFCKVGPQYPRQYVIGEFTVLRFNLRDGIRDHYHEIINPGPIPIGYHYDAKLGSKELGLELPDEDPAMQSNFIQILSYIIDYLRLQTPQDRPERSQKVLPPIFTLPDKIGPVQDFILQLCSHASEDDRIFRVYKLDTLLFVLINSMATCSDDRLPRQSLAMTILRQDSFRYSPRIECEHHHEIDKAVKCTRSRVSRWAYSVLDHALPLAGIKPVAGKHVPIKIDLEGLFEYKDQKKDWPGLYHGSAAAASSSSSTADNSSGGSGASTSNAKPTETTHTPLRTPYTDYSKMIQPPPEPTAATFSSYFTALGRGKLIEATDSKITRPAPELTPATFPSLSVALGRGRGLASRMKKMNIN